MDRRGEDETATHIIAEMIGQLHSVPQDAPRDGSFTLERWFGALFDKTVANKRAG